MRASAPRRRKIKMILAAMMWYLRNILFPLLLTTDDDRDDDDACHLASPFLQDAPNASLLRVVSLVGLYERARRDNRWYYKYQLSDLPTRRGCLWGRIQAGGRPEAYANFLGLDIKAFEVLLTRYEEAYGRQFPR